jgi:energy-coupling factor transporter ATP-binding protein EcfA2
LPTREFFDKKAGEKKSEKRRGEVGEDGQKKNPGTPPHFLSRLSLSPLSLSAALKLPTSTSAAARASRVTQVIDQLALAGCRDVRIGSVLARGISGGQAKRVNIGLALVSRPKVLFLDEPTSGLDSYTSNKVMDIVAGLARSGLTVCATVHSPTSHIYGLFDRLTMLAAGRVLWSGAAGVEPITFLEGALPDVPRFLAGGSPDAPQGVGQAARPSDNAAEWLVDVTTAADRDGRAGALADAYAASPAAASAAKEVDALLASNRPSLPAAATKALATRTATTTPAWWGVWTLLSHRGARDLRDPEFLGPRIGDKIFVAVLIAALYSRLGNKGDVERG